MHSPFETFHDKNCNGDCEKEGFSTDHSMNKCLKEVFDLDHPRWKGFICAMLTDIICSLALCYEVMGSYQESRELHNAGVKLQHVRELDNIHVYCAKIAY